MGEKRSRSSTKAWASLRPKHSSIKFPACCAAFTLDHGNPDWPMDIMMGLVVGDVPFHDLKNPTQGYLEPNLFVSLEIFLALLTIILVAKMFPTSIKPNFFPTGLYPSRRKKKNVRLKARPWLPATGINVQISAHRSNLIWSHQRKNSSIYPWFSK